ncbi:fibrobacter succinogenes major paralogous domain-containing protein [Gaetbulibacter sp. M240]|uniref:fibrobacter succinogenes major paralogous domain-containing protein n=1 Tax=Gaetbulibacter sp. M240 TaxID=3126511 RepID=UPI00374EC8BF
MKKLTPSNVFLFFILTFILFQNCQKDSPENDAQGFDCISGDCTPVESGGAYASLSSCQSDCGSSTMSTMTDSRDGEIYAIVTIESQSWMAENLRYNAPGSWLNPDYPSSKYGRLYYWDTMMNGGSSSFSSPSGVQGICPNGWHIPSDAEWGTLEVASGMNPGAATITGYRDSHGIGMKSTTGWNSNGNGTNELGFNVLPSGFYLVLEKNFHFLGSGAYFWTSSEFSSTWAFYRQLDNNEDGVNRDLSPKNYGFACRCVKD